MVTPEQARILGYLRHHVVAPFDSIVAACLPGSPRDWAGRTLADLEWLGYVTVYSTREGEPASIELTAIGIEYLQATDARVPAFSA